MIINRIDKDIIIKIILFNSIRLIIKIIFNKVIFGEKFINIIFKLFIMQNIFIINHKFNVIFKVNMILFDIEKNIGIKFIKLI